jgi:hypothetical protein
MPMKTPMKTWITSKEVDEETLYGEDIEAPDLEAAKKAAQEKGFDILGERRSFTPKVDTKKSAEEVKAYIDREKMNFIDYGSAVIQMYPHPRDEIESMPELCAFAAQWEEMFNYADGVTGRDGENFPHESAKIFDDAVQAIALAVNTDREFWDKIREEVIPLYDRHPSYDQWKERWSSVKMNYDPVPINVRVTRKESTKEGQTVKSEVVTDRNVPAGFVVDVQ